jgi:hypothetical protein
VNFRLVRICHPFLEHRILHLALCPIQGGQYTAFTATNPLTATTVILLSASGGFSIADFLIGKNAGDIRLQANNQFWLDVKRQIFCALPDDGVLTSTVLESLAQAIERNISTSPDANQLVASILRGMTSEAASRAAIVGAVYEGSPNGCDSCFPSCQLTPLDNDSLLADLGQDRWKLEVTSFSPDTGYYVGRYRLPYNHNCCALTIEQIITAPTPIPGETIVYALVHSCDQPIPVRIPLSSLSGQCVNEFAIISNSPFELDVSLTDCQEEPEEPACQIYFEKLGSRVYLSPNAEGVYLLYSSSYGNNAPQPDAEGFSHYHLTDCCGFEVVPTNDTSYGVIPTTVRTFDCAGNPTDHTIQNSSDLLALNGRCVQAVAFKPAYYVALRTTACTPVTDTVAFETASSATQEGATHTVAVRLSLSIGSTPQEIRVPIVIAGGSATSGSDYTLDTPEIIFPAGSPDGALQTVSLTIAGDQQMEGSETIVLGFGEITGPAAPGSLAQHTITVIDSGGCTQTQDFAYTWNNIGWEHPDSIGIAHRHFAGTPVGQYDSRRSVDGVLQLAWAEPKRLKKVRVRIDGSSGGLWLSCELFINGVSQGIRSSKVQTYYWDWAFSEPLAATHIRFEGRTWNVANASNFINMTLTECVD